MASCAIKAGWSAVLLLAIAASGSPRSAGAQPSNESAFLSYRLVDTWSESPWQPEAGRMGAVVDTTITPDGRSFVLDARQSALHVFATDGNPINRLPLPDPGGDEGWRARRLDAAPDGRLLVLYGRTDEEGRTASRLDGLSADGILMSRFELPLRYRDIAAGHDGVVYLVRTVPAVAPAPVRGPTIRPRGGLDKFDAGGQLLARIEGAPLYLPVAVDAEPHPAGDETVRVANWLPVPSGAPSPGPAPTARPDSERIAEAAVASLFQSATEPEEEGVVVFDASLAQQSVVPFYGPEDIAAGRTGVWVTRATEMWPLADTPLADEPAWQLNEGQIAIPSYGPVMTLAVPPALNRADNATAPAIVAGVAHCHVQAVARFASRPAPRGGGRPTWHGSTDAPPLSGPQWPLAVATLPDGGLAVLQGRMTLRDEDPLPPVATGPWGREDQVVQLWRRGEPRVQLGLCGDANNWFEVRHDARTVLDVATGSNALYTAAPELIEARFTAADRPLPRWTWWPGLALDPDGDDADAIPRLAAIDAHDDWLAMLDVGRDLVVIARDQGTVAGAAVELDTGPTTTQAWRASAALDGAVPIDIALVFAPGQPSPALALASTAGRVAVHELGGQTSAVWSTLDSPRRMAPTPNGELVILGGGGWLEHRTIDGSLRAMWRAPLPDAATDLAVGDDGRVFVTYAVTGEGNSRLPVGYGEAQGVVEEAGVWIFAPEEQETEPVVVVGDDCWATGEKGATPAVVHLGEAVTVTLTLAAGCPPRAPPLRLVLVMDSSRSMSWNGALERAQRLVGSMLAHVDGSQTEVTVIAYDGSARLVSGQAVPPAEAARAVATLRADGDSLLGDALVLAEQQLASPGRPGIRDVVLIVTDGAINDHPASEADALRRSGAEIRVLVLPHPSFDGLRITSLGHLAGDVDHVHVDLDQPRAAALAERITARNWPHHEWRDLRVIDQVPANMTYVDGSADPPAIWESATRRLHWLDQEMSTVGRRGHWSFVIRPSELGLHPTNDFATATWATDHHGEGSFTFPVPRVKVWDRASLTFTAFLPLGARGACVRPAPLAVAIAIDASSSMDELVAESGPSKIVAAREAAGTFILGLRETDRVALVTFSGSAGIDAPLSRNRDPALAALQALTTSQGTRIDAALAASGAALASSSVVERRVTILLTDGHHNGAPQAVKNAAADLVADGHLLYAIALGQRSDSALLGDIAPGRVIQAEGVTLATDFTSLLERIRCESAP